MAVIDSKTDGADDRQGREREGDGDIAGVGAAEVGNVAGNSCPDSVHDGSPILG
jgi:hypothetical protein